jgi:hypothetical protein
MFSHHNRMLLTLVASRLVNSPGARWTEFLHFLPWEQLSTSRGNFVVVKSSIRLDNTNLQTVLSAFFSYVRLLGVKAQFFRKCSVTTIVMLAPTSSYPFGLPLAANV